MAETVDQPGTERLTERHDNRNAARRARASPRRRGALSDEHMHSLLHQLRRERIEPLDGIGRGALLQRDILSLDVAQFAQAFAECVEIRGLRLARPKKTDPPDFRLRMRPPASENRVSRTKRRRCTALLSLTMAPVPETRYAKSGDVHIAQTSSPVRDCNSPRAASTRLRACPANGGFMHSPARHYSTM